MEISGWSQELLGVWKDGSGVASCGMKASSRVVWDCPGQSKDRGIPKRDLALWPRDTAALGGQAVTSLLLSRQLFFFTWLVMSVRCN